MENYSFNIRLRRVVRYICDYYIELNALNFKQLNSFWNLRLTFFTSIYRLYSKNNIFDRTKLYWRMDYHRVSLLVLASFNGECKRTFYRLIMMNIFPLDVRQKLEIYKTWMFCVRSTYVLCSGGCAIFGYHCSVILKKGFMKTMQKVIWKKSELSEDVNKSQNITKGF